jgi:hypothetical protein
MAVITRRRRTATISITFPAADCTTGTAIIATITARWPDRTQRCI